MNVAVTVKNEGGGRINVYAFSARAKYTSQNVTSMKFKIPVSFPFQEAKYESGNWVVT